MPSSRSINPKRSCRDRHLRSNQQAQIRWLFGSRLLEQNGEIIFQVYPREREDSGCNALLRDAMAWSRQIYLHENIYPARDVSPG